MSGFDDAVNHLVELVGKMAQVEGVTPLYGKPNWGISFEATWGGIKTVATILEHIISDEMKQYNFHAYEISVTITTIDSDNHRQSVKVIFTEFPTI
jgi:hypothetical protein